MKNIDFDTYIEVLNSQVTKGTIKEKTARTYIGCMERILIELKGKDSPSDIREAIECICKDNEQGAKYIAAIKKYERDVLDSPKSLLYGKELFDLRRNHKQKPIGRELKLNDDTYLRKINRINNLQIKLAFRLQARSGLRVSEVSDLEREDIAFGDDNILIITVKQGKGGKSRTVRSIPDEYLYSNLQKYLLDCGPKEKIFYSAEYLRHKAAEYDIPTHDLRRLNSRMRFRKQRGEGAGKRAARRVVQHELGHEKPKTTNAYLGTDWDE